MSFKQCWSKKLLHVAYKRYIIIVVNIIIYNALFIYDPMFDI